MNPICLTRRTFLSAVGISCVGAMADASAKGLNGLTAFDSVPKAAWLWGFDPARSSELNAFAVRHKISTLFVSLPRWMRDQISAGDSQGVEAIRRLAVGGVRVLALAGDPSWAKQPAVVPIPLRQILEFQSRFGLFAGLHLDVEPHTLPEWRSGEQARLDLSAGLAQFAKMAAVAGAGLPIEAALHPGLAAIRSESGANALEAVAGNLSVASIMAYRDNAADTIRRAASAVDILETAGIPWRLGVLVHETNEARTSFVGAPSREFLMSMRELDARFRRKSDGALFRGLAFEDLAGLRHLLADDV